KPSKVRLDRAVRVYRSYAAYPNISTKIRGGANEQDREQRGPQQRVQNCCNVAAGALHAAGLSKKLAISEHRAGAHCSREDSNLHGLPHTVLSRTRLPIPPRELKGRGKLLVTSVGATPNSH